MINTILTKIFGSQHEREVKRMLPIVAAINEMEPQIQKLSDDELRAKTAELRTQLDNGASLDDVLIPAFAVAREGAWRSVKMRPFDVQLMGGVVLHKGRIAEMRTGEGKTLVATLPVYLNALEGKGVHVVTVNDYLAKRDSDWMGQIYRFLGLSVGVIQHDMPDADRKRAYAADVTYGTNNEFGFDYLRDNMKFDLESMVQRGHHYAIVDEVDSILIDEARTPLIISGPSEESIDKYYRIDRIIPRLVKGEEIDEGDGKKSTTGDYLVDEKAHQASLTDDGVEKVEQLLGLRNLYDPENMEVLHGVNQALRAHALYQRDVEYLIKDGKVVIVDEFTGRMMPGRRWSDGLHQAVEAKEGVKIERENQTLATITFQNFFRMYKKLAGMTGTADTEAAEFGQIYNLDVTVIPTNRDMIRDDRADLVYRTAGEKWNAVVEEIREAQKKGQPVLVGTVSIEKSEMLSKLLNRPPKVPHIVLNAKYHEREASIVAQAGRKGAVTIATNMAGRGTDIVLGGNPEGLARSEADPETEPEAFEEALERYQRICAEEREEVLKLGGLHILGTERHESRRIDNQLRGRSGRQGDPGSSRFYLSLEDDLMRIFGSDRIQGLMGKLGMEEGEAIEHGMVSKAIERAQKQVEARNFEIRKHLLEYDDVMNKQREAIYKLRRDILEGREGREYVVETAEGILDSLIETHCPEKADPQDWNMTGLRTDMLAYFNINAGDMNLDEMGIEELRESLWKVIERRYNEKEQRHAPEVIRSFERAIMLHAVDVAWKDHLLAIDHLKEGISLRGYGQRDPLNEYKRESYDMFQSMKERVEDDIIQKLFRYEPITEEQQAAAEVRRPAPAPLPPRPAPKLEFSAPPKSEGQRPQPAVNKDVKVGRNDPCPCGSGKKYKKCHGAQVTVG
ncbi:MAG TPA: preprotein translocase subunit SecA [Thermoanaerobaculia bacterium]|nr:preprotein translocase subunit SecA [Thermoanaerobaculia bacterium]